MSELFESLQVALADRYQLKRELGRGGMATVYLAHDIRHSRDVALKILRAELAGVMTRGRFLREIRISSELTHPLILPLLDSGTVPPTDHAPALPFYTMPFVDGESLRDRLKREKQLPLEDALAVAEDVAEALAHAHAHGVVHRDIKPENILLMGGHAVVADFGIAKAVFEAVDPEAATSAGLVIGTAAYMSPEQAGGEQDLDGRSDIYALGCVLYEMLGGEPPFTGPSPHAVLARHRIDQVPSLLTLRPTVPLAVSQTVRRALEKSPADRFATPAQFVASLHAPPAAEAGAPRGPLRTILVSVALVAIAILAWQLTHRASPLDPNKVVVFPLGETPAGAIQEGTGVIVALMIGSALEYTDPLVWIDGEPRLDAASRRDATALTATELHRITREAGARWFLDGSVLRRGDSVTVILRLNDTEGDSVVARSSATRTATEAAQAGLAAVNQILPRLLAPGQQMADLSALANRRPAAVALWLQGEREYRSFNFVKAIEFQQRAIEEDSLLAVAAVRGAQAANWVNRTPETSAFSELALKNLSLLPGRMSPFVRGLHAYGIGEADSAVALLREALEASPDWTEAHMSLGEVYFHEIPTTAGRLDSLAEVAFTAAAVDSGFSPPRFHLAELAIRSGDTMRAKAAVQTFFRLTQPEASREERAELLLMLDCARQGRKGIPWKEVVAQDLPGALSTAAMLPGGGNFLDCAEDGFRTVFENPSASLAERWGAFLGLHGVLAAEGRISELKALVRSAIAAGLGVADRVYVLDALAGMPVDAEASEVARRIELSPLEAAASYELWLAGEWRAHVADSVGVERMRWALADRAERTDVASTRRFASVLRGRLLLLRGDTTAAVEALGGAMGGGRRELLIWTLGESLAPDRLLLAELMLARGDYKAAIQIAGTFDHREPMIFLAYLPASLVLRRRAALALGDTSEAAMYERRLIALGQDEALSRSSIPHNAEAP